jgi:hypothetical protein
MSPAPPSRAGLRSSGATFVLSGALFFTKGVLELTMGPPPDGAALLDWVRTHQVPLAWTNEVFFFAALLLLPGLWALAERLATDHRAHAVLGVGLFATTIPMMAVLAIVHGRLMYPMFGLQVRTPEVAEFIIATYFGGLHAVALLRAVATVVVCLALRHQADRVGPTAVMLVSGVSSAWLIALGWWLARPVHQAARPIR